VASFLEIQGTLDSVLAVNTSHSRTPHVVVALPSYSLGESLLSHYGDRVMALEHRYLLSGLMTHRLPHAEWVYLCSMAPSMDVMTYYRYLGPRPDGFAERAHVVSVGDRTMRSMAAKLLDRPDVLDGLRARIDGRPAVIEPWNVTDDEVAVAEHLGIPINGMDPSLRPLGFKSAGRRLFRQAGAPLPLGMEDVRTVSDVLSAVTYIRRIRTGATGVVIKHDDSGAGDGNVVLSLVDVKGDALGDDDLRQRLVALPEWYLTDLERGGIVEELLTGSAFTSPSAQIDIHADGRVIPLATHEQILGGESGQVFLGCRFPANPAYAAELARHAVAIGHRLAAAGVTGRASVDFGAVLDDAGAWTVSALEVNLRKGGTTHPYAALRNLVPGHYDADRGQWVAQLDGRPRAYACTDNLVDPEWLGLPAGVAIDAVRNSGLEFDHRTGTGVVLHMLAGLDIDGRCGLMAIAHDEDACTSLFEGAQQAVERAAQARA
jgi:hypothetical protein